MFIEIFNAKSELTGLVNIDKIVTIGDYQRLNLNTGKLEDAKGSCLTVQLPGDDLPYLEIFTTDTREEILNKIKEAKKGN